MSANANWPDWYPGVVPNFAENPNAYGEPLPETLARFDSLPTGSRIADIAGGYGRYAVPLAEAGHHVTIADNDEGHLAEARRRTEQLPPGAGTITAEETIDVIEGNLASVGDVEAVLCAGFIYLAPEAVIKNAARRMTGMLRQSGLMVIEFATNRDRRNPDGESLIGPNEQNYTHDEGEAIVQQIYDEFDNYRQQTVPVRLRNPYYLDAEVIVASGIKG